MHYNFSDIGLMLWTAQTLVAILFALGFIGIDAYLWESAFDQRRMHRNGYRVALSALPVVVVALLLGGEYAAYMESMLLLNLAAFILLVPLFDDQISIGEYLLRAACVVGLWVYYHGQSWSSWSLVAICAIVGLLSLIRYEQKRGQYHPLIVLLGGWFMGAAFWGTLPRMTIGLQVDGRLRGQAIVMFGILTITTAFSWQVQRRERRAQRQMAQLATYDEVTGVSAYQRDQQDLETLFATAKRQHTPLVLAAVDVDHLRKLNQDYGHLAANAILMQVAALLQARLAAAGHDQHLYRFGGEEFTIALPDVDLASARELLIDCWQAVRNHDFTYAEKTLKAHISIGATVMQATDQRDDDLYKRADDSLYTAKKSGGDTLVIDRTPWASAQGAPTYAFFAQPIMYQNQRFASELLLRSFDEDNQHWVLPARFDLPVAQQVDLLYQAVAHLACSRVAINLTLAQFADPQTAAALIACYQHDAGPSALTVEIVDVPDLATTRRISAMYRDAGIRIHIDDVGSDNSYELVRELIPYVDGVKFAIQNLRQHEDDERIHERIRFWAEVARKNHLRLILEGVETQADVDFATALGITYFQGYFFAKPSLPAE